jgi:hypothetical protein
LPVYLALSDAERIELAKAATSRLVNDAIHLLSIHYGNDIVGYSDKLASQIPVSHAANAFNVFRDSYFKFEATRLSALWDVPKRGDAEMQSIPTVAALVARPTIEERLRQEHLDAYGAGGGHLLNPSKDPEMRAFEIEALKRSHEAFSERQADKLIVRLRHGLRWTSRVMQSKRLQSVINARNKSIAHSLIRTKLEIKQSVEPMRYGDERFLLWKSIAIINCLYLGINGVSFDWHESMDYAKSNAEALWHNCTFSISN